MTLEQLAESIANEPEVLGFVATLDPSNPVDVLVSHVEHAAKSLLRAETCRFVRASTVESAVVSNPLCLRITMRANGTDPVGTLLAERSTGAVPFSAREIPKACTLAAAAAPVLAWAMVREGLSHRLTSVARTPTHQLFRAEALESHAASKIARKPVGATEARWVRHAVWAVVVAAAVVLNVLSLTTVDDVVEAPFTIRALGAPAIGESSWRAFSALGRMVPIRAQAVLRADDQRGSYEFVAVLRRSVFARPGIVPTDFTLRFDGNEALSLAVAATSVTVTRTAGSERATAALVEAALPAVAVGIDGRVVHLREGMSGRVSFRVGSTPVFLQLLPHRIRFHH